MTTEILRLTYETDFGSDGEDSDPINPLSRAVNRLFEDGQPFKRLNMCCLSDDGDLYRWFGVFIKSAADRILFFPGCKKTIEPIVGFHGNRLRWNQVFNLDHMSLERGFRNWHISSSKSTAHLGKLPTADLGEGRYLWFAISLSQNTVFREFQKRTIITTKAPSSDSKRRTQVFFNSRDGANFHILGVHPDARNMFPEGFLHISIIVGPSGFDLYRGEKHGYPENSPFLSKPLPIGSLQIPVRLHILSLSDSVDIQITTAWLPGALNTPFTLTAIT